MRERYSIEVTDEVVEIFGDLTIEEAFDFLSFFERKGYKSVILGSENSTLRMLKRDQEEVIHDQFILTLKEQITDYKVSFEKECKAHESTAQKLRDVEVLMKQVMSEEYAKYKALYEENQKLLRTQQFHFLNESPEVKQMLKSGGFIAESVRTMKDIISSPLSKLMTEEEKDGAFNQLLNMKNDPNGPKVPTWEEYKEEMKNDSTT